MNNSQMDIIVAGTWEKVKTARGNSRFKGMEILTNVFDDFFELHGDRNFGDDQAIIGGLASVNGIAVTVIVQNKVNSLEKGLIGMAKPEGYRKALRLMKQADKFGRPVVNIIDTPGAYPGIEAEERGQAEAIAKNLYEMSLLSVPIISVIIGEGGSGGALALSVANKIFMYEKAIFSVVSPEGCASILWKDRSLAPMAAVHLKLTSENLYSLGVIDGIILESQSKESIYAETKEILVETIQSYIGISRDVVIKERSNKYRQMGNFFQ